MENIFAKDIQAPGATDEELSSLPLPTRYKQLLKQHNGGKLNRCYFRSNAEKIYHIVHLYGTNMLLNPLKPVFPDLLVISHDPWNWDYEFLLDHREDRSNPAVYHRDLDKPMIKIADSFGEFIDGLYKPIGNITIIFQSIDDHLLQNINTCFHSNLSKKSIPFNQGQSIEVTDGFLENQYKMFLGDNRQTHSFEDDVHFYLTIDIPIEKRDSLYTTISNLKKFYDFKVVDDF